MRKAVQILMWSLCAVLSITFFFPAHGFAQSDVGTISGFVRDQSGAAVPNAKVTILNESTGESHTVTSDSQGHYTLTNLRPAVYSMRVNFEYIDKYPHYVFNWTGANRYRLMKEYFPADYARMQQYVSAGRWFPAGSSIEEGDVNLPSAEGIFRQILYGNEYFRKDFGKASTEYMEW